MEFINYYVEAGAIEKKNTLMLEDSQWEQMIIKI